MGNEWSAQEKDVQRVALDWTADDVEAACQRYGIKPSCFVHLDDDDKPHRGKWKERMEARGQDRVALISPSCFLQPHGPFPSSDNMVAIMTEYEYYGRDLHTFCDHHDVKGTQILRLMMGFHAELKALHQKLHERNTGAPPIILATTSYPPAEAAAAKAPKPTLTNKEKAKKRYG